MIFQHASAPHVYHHGLDLTNEVLPVPVSTAHNEIAMRMGRSQDMTRDILENGQTWHGVVPAGRCLRDEPNVFGEAPRNQGAGRSGQQLIVYGAVRLKSCRTVE